LLLQKGEKYVFWRASKYLVRPDLFSLCLAENYSTEKTQGEKTPGWGIGFDGGGKEDEKRSFKWYQAWTCIWVEEVVIQPIQEG